MDEQEVDALALSTLKSLGLPVARVFYTGNAEQWISYHILSGCDTEFADDAPGATEYTYRAHIFSKTNYMPILKRMRRKLKAAGFDGVEVEAELYEEDTGYYHIPVKFYYTEVL